VTDSNITPPFVGQTMPNLSTPLTRLGFAAMMSDIGFLAAVDVTLVELREQAIAACSAMAAMLASAQRPTADSARAVRHHAHVMGLPVGGAR